MRVVCATVLALLLIASCRSPAIRPAASQAVSSAPAAATEPATTQPVSSQPSVPEVVPPATQPTARMSSLLPSLGPATLWVREEGEWLIDLDTARTGALPEGMSDPRQVQAWLAEQGFDLAWQLDPLVGDRLVFLAAAMQVGRQEDWDRASPRMIREAMADAAPAAWDPAVTLEKDQLPVVFLIRTREGGLGILRACDPGNSGAGVEIQYRMVEPSERSDLASPSPVDRARVLRRLREAAAVVESDLMRLRGQTDGDDLRIARLEKQLQILRQRIRILEQPDDTATVVPASRPAQ